MSDNSWIPIAAQPEDVRGLPESERNALLISATQVNGQWVILSRYGDDIWQLDGFPSNTPPNRKRMDFGTVPSAFRAVMKAMMYRYLRRGRNGTGRPKGSMIKQSFSEALQFLRYLETLKLDRLSAVSRLVCASYVAACRTHRQTRRSKGMPLSQRGLQGRFTAIEALHDLSQYTDDPIPQHPWPETSARAMAGLTGSHRKGGKTPLIPDDVFCVLFEQAYKQVECGKQLLDLRDELDALAEKRKELPAHTKCRARSHQLSTLGWDGSLGAFKSALHNLRTACYIVLASTSGCRNHELAHVQSGAHLRTLDDESTVYHWMRSRSDKTDTGMHDWMIPEAGVRALRIMERWAAPYQAMVAAEIEQRRRANPLDPEIAEAQRHRHAWCTADNGGCVGNTLERTRCGNCTHAVIGARHVAIYKRFYCDLKELLDCPDIGEGGRRRVERDLNRCRDVFAQLGIDSETLIT